MPITLPVHTNDHLPAHACAGCEHEHDGECDDKQHDHNHSRRQAHAHAGPSDADAEAALQRQRLLFASFGQVLRSKVRMLCIFDGS